MIYSSVNKTDTYIELSEGENKLIMPTSAAIIVDDESGLKTIKSVGSRKNIASFREENE